MSDFCCIGEATQQKSYLNTVHFCLMSGWWLEPGFFLLSIAVCMPLLKVGCCHSPISHGMSQSFWCCFTAIICRAYLWCWMGWRQDSVFTVILKSSVLCYDPWYYAYHHSSFRNRLSGLCLRAFDVCPTIKGTSIAVLLVVRLEPMCLWSACSADVS